MSELLRFHELSDDSRSSLRADIGIQALKLYECSLGLPLHQSSGRHVLIAIQQHEVCAVANVEMRPQSLPPHLYLAGIAVDPNRRNKGIGTSMMQHIFGWAEAKGARQIQLIPSSPDFMRHGDLVRFYKKLKFVQLPRNRHWVRNL